MQIRASAHSRIYPTGSIGDRQKIVEAGYQVITVLIVSEYIHSQNYI